MYRDKFQTFSDIQVKPRERIHEKGPRALRDWELTALLLGSGNRNRNVKELAQDLVSLMDRKSNQLKREDLTQIKGIGSAKASTILAALELGRRKLYPMRKLISHPSHVLPYLEQYLDRKQECFFVLSLTGASELQKIRMVSQGTVNRTLVHPREVFADLVVERAASAIIAHNHPSGNLTPSPEDRAITQRLRHAGELLGIDLLDHIIFGEQGYYSFLEQGEFE